MSTRRKLLSLLLACCLILALFAACNGADTKQGEPTKASTAESTDEVVKEEGTNDTLDASLDPYSPYEETVTFTKGITVSGGENFSEGDDYFNNPYTRYIKETVNVAPEQAWQVDRNNYEQKIALSIAAGDIPDMMVVGRTIYNQLLENDLIWDLTDRYDTTVSPYIKEIHESYGDLLMNQIRRDGKIYGIPGTQLSGQHSLLWVRQDWLNTLGLEAPTTLEDLESVAKAFVENDMSGTGSTIGFTMVETVYGGYNGQHAPYTVFGLYDAYPGRWLEEDGKIIYGSTQPQMKEALAKFAEYYSNGILDKEFAVRKGADREALIASGQAGILFAPWWGWGGIPDAITNNPDADWVVVPAPVDENGKLKIFQQDPLNSVMVISKAHPQPEAIIKALNVGQDVGTGKGDAKEAYLKLNEESPNLMWSVRPVAVQLDYDNALEIVLDDITQALEKEDVGALKDIRYTNMYDTIMRERANPKADVYNWQEAYIRTDGQAAATWENNDVKPVAFFGTTETMTTKWANLEKMETQILIQIVMGEATLDDFDTFVDQWHKAGGDEIIAEIEAEIASR